MFAQRLIQLDHNFSFGKATKALKYILPTVSKTRVHTVNIRYNLTTILTQNLHTVLSSEQNKNGFITL